MKETVYRIRSISNCMEKAFETMDFTLCDKKSRKIDYTIMELSRQLRAGNIDCVWFDNSYEKVVWTRSLKHQGAIQITSFSQKDGLPNGDEQATDYEEMIDIARRNEIYNGVKLHALTI